MAKKQPQKQTRSTAQAALMEEKGFLSVAAVAKATGTVPQTVRRWIHDGRVKGTVVPPKAMYVSRTSLVEFLGRPAAQRFGILKTKAG